MEGKLQSQYKDKCLGKQIKNKKTKNFIFKLHFKYL